MVLAGLYAVYRMMDMFLLPLTWAFLLGTVLFPVKYRLDLKFKGKSFFLYHITLNQYSRLAESFG